jgi:hypothetical protein
VLSDAILEMLIEMSAETESTSGRKKRVSVLSLAALYSMYVQSAGYGRRGLYGEYEAERLYRRRLKINKILKMRSQKDPLTGCAGRIS